MLQQMPAQLLLVEQGAIDDRVCELVMQLCLHHLCLHQLAFGLDRRIMYSTCAKPTDLEALSL